MATVNNRIIQGVQAHVINGIQNGMPVRHRIQAGFDDQRQNPVDGLQLSMVDLITEFVRGEFASLDWVHFIELLTGIVGTNVFYQRKSGAPEAGGYIKHTLNNPVIYKMALSLKHRKDGEISGSYECRAADETKGMTDMWEKLDNQNAPTYIGAVRALEIATCVFGSSLDVYHVTGLDVYIEMPLLKASHDGDVGYTAVDAVLSGLRAYGTLTMQDAEITDSQCKGMQLCKAGRDNLVLAVKQAQGVTEKILTLAGVMFTSVGHNTSNPEAGGNPNPDEFSVPFIVANDASTPLTLAGTNKILTIA